MMDVSDDSMAMDICNSGDRIVSGQRVLVYPVPKVRIALFIAIWLVGTAFDVWSPGALIGHSAWLPWLQTSIATVLFWVVSIGIITQRPKAGVFGRLGDASFIDLRGGARIEVERVSDLTENGRLLLFATQILFCVLAAALAFMALRLWTSGTRQPLLLLWPAGSVAWVLALGWFRRTRYTLIGSLGGRSQRLRLRMEAGRPL